jgi:hypothetical protein
MTFTIKPSLLLLVLPALILPQQPPPVPAPPSVPTTPANNEVVFVGAGDIGHCDMNGAELTGKLLDEIPGTVFTVGDNAYTTGSYQNYVDCYDPWWGRHKDRTRPAPGNHDYETPGAEGYFSYFGSRAGKPGEGYYHFTLGAWNIYSLNSHVAADASSAQYKWLATQLAGKTSKCTLAYWHNPVRSSGRNGDTAEMVDIWKLLYDHGAEVVLSGHEHHYERFAPMNPSFELDTARGIREFVVGTGGGPRYPFDVIKPLSEVRLSVWGLLKLTLRPEDYSWEFLAVSGDRTRDQGTGVCH